MSDESGKKQQQRERLDKAARLSLLRANGIDPESPQLPLWAEDFRGLPNDYARSELFTVRNKREPRRLMQGNVLYHYDSKIRVTFTGIELRADDDELVWQQIIHYARTVPLGDPVAFNLHQLCRDVAWSVNGRNYGRLRECISRLKANEVRVDHLAGMRGVGLSLIERYSFDGAAEEEGTRYKVWIDKGIVTLFLRDNYTRLPSARYKALRPIARRLMDWACSHKVPFPLAADTFRRICGSTTVKDGKWLQQVREACAQIEAEGLVKSAQVVDGCIHISR